MTDYRNTIGTASENRVPEDSGGELQTGANSDGDDIGSISIDYFALADKALTAAVTGVASAIAVKMILDDE